jgi:TRAP transporter TAXI family solute receptor
MSQRWLVLIAGICALASLPAAAQPINMTLVGASPAGLWSSLGVGIGAAVAAAYPGSTITYQTSSGGLANAQLVSDGRVPLGIAADMELNAAVTGAGPFKGKPLSSLRTLARVYDSGSTRFQMFQAVLDKAFADRHGVTGFADIVAKKIPVRVAVNRPGNMDGDVALDILEGVGLTEAVIKANGGSLVRAATAEMTSLMQDRRIDLAFAGYAFNHAGIREMARSFTPMLLSVPRPVAENVAAKNYGEVCAVKPGEYEWNTQPVETVCVGGVVMVKASMPEDTAYRLAKALVEKVENFHSGHKALRSITPAMMVKPGAAPFHPGALKYYREAGLVK